MSAEEAGRAIVEGEAKFYEMGQEQGTRTAFLHFLAEDSIVFNPTPMKGQEVWNRRPEGAISLKWQPVFAAMSRGADLGFTTGPSEWRKNKSDPEPFGYGQYISIWKKQKDGAWKVALDVGTENPKPLTPPPGPELSFSNEAMDVQADRAAARRRLGEAQQKFSEAAKSDSTDALVAAARDDIRIYREGMLPGLGKEAAGLMLSVRRGKLARTPLGGEMSVTGDLAYSYGRYTLTGTQSGQRGHYLQIWRTGKDGVWKLALDYQTPLPPEEKKPAS